MSIKPNVGLGVIAVAVTDTVLIQGTAGTIDRVSIGALNLHNDGSAGATITVELYVSPDLTSASGERVAYYEVGDNDSKDVNELIGEGLENLNIIAVADQAGCNAHPTVTQYDGGS